MAKLGIVRGDGWMSNLTKYFTGSTAYHTFWQTDEYIYDMWLLRRRQERNKYQSSDVVYYDFPHVTQDYLELMLTYDDQEYGFVDYFLFSLRWFFHLFGKSTPNVRGQICSEMCNNDLNRCGYKTPFTEVPSPADLERWISQNPKF